MQAVQRENTNALEINEYMATLDAGAEAHKQDVAADLRGEERPEHNMPEEGTLERVVWVDGYRGHREHFLEQLAVAQWKIKQRRKRQTGQALRWGWWAVSALAIASLFLLIRW
jgi:hypothetical protein